MSAPPDVTLVNAERAPEHRPAPSPERVDPCPGYWPGPASLHALHWRARAIAAERQLDELRRQLARYRFRP